MEEDLIIGSPNDITEDDIVEAEPDEKDYAAEAYYMMQTYATLMEIDTTILSNGRDKKRIEQMKRYSLRVAHAHIKQIYEENFNGDIAGIPDSDEG